MISLTIESDQHPGFGAGSSTAHAYLTMWRPRRYGELILSFRRQVVAGILWSGGIQIPYGNMRFRVVSAASMVRTPAGYGLRSNGS